MKRRSKVSELMQREGLRGEIVQLFHSARTGIIHGSDGYHVTFTGESLVLGLGYSDLTLGLRVSYGIFFATGAKLPSAINVQTAVGDPTETTDDARDAISTRTGGTGVA